MVKNGKTGGYKAPSRQRESNLELFRIITMLLIVAHHFVVNSGLTSPDGPITANPNSWRSMFLLLMGAWGKTGINCFVMITGYFMCKSSITARKFAKLFFEVMFYRIVFLLVFLLSGYQSFSLVDFAKTIIPVWQLKTNFTSCFLIFYLCIPFLNKLISNIDERNHIRLLCLTSFTYIVLGTIHTVSFNYVTWFCVVYFIASYIRLYPKKIFQNKLIISLMLLCSIGFSVASVIVGNKFSRPFIFVTDSNSFLPIVIGVFAFLFFKNLTIKYNKVINTIAASTFGVLLIHANSDTMRQWLWKDTVDCIGHYGSHLMPFYAIACVLGIFAVCVVIDIIRIRFIEKPFFILWDKYWNSFDKWFQKIEESFLKKLNIE